MSHHSRSSEKSQRSGSPATKLFNKSAYKQAIRQRKRRIVLAENAEGAPAAAAAFRPIQPERSDSVTTHYYGATPPPAYESPPPPYNASEAASSHASTERFRRTMPDWPAWSIRAVERSHEYRKAARHAAYRAPNAARKAAKVAKIAAQITAASHNDPASAMTDREGLRKGKIEYAKRKRAAALNHGETSWTSGSTHASSEGIRGHNNRKRARKYAARAANQAAAPPP